MFALFAVDQRALLVEPAVFAKGNGNGDTEGEGNGDGVGRIDGEGVGKIDGDGSAEADGDGLGKIDGEGSGKGEGKGSPTCITVRGASGLRCERSVEGIAGGATGADGGRFLTSSKFGRIPSGALAIGVGLFSWNRCLNFDARPPLATPNGASDATSNDEQANAAMDFEIARAAKN